MPSLQRQSLPVRPEEQDGWSMASLKIICLIWFAGIFSPSATETRHGWGEKKCGGSLLKHWFNTDIILKPDTTGNRYWSSWWAFTHSGCVGAEGRPTKKILSCVRWHWCLWSFFASFTIFGSANSPATPEKIKIAFIWWFKLVCTQSWPLTC